MTYHCNIEKSLIKSSNAQHGSKMHTSASGNDNNGKMSVILDNIYRGLSLANIESRNIRMSSLMEADTSNGVANNANSNNNGSNIGTTISTRNNSDGVNAIPVTLEAVRRTTAFAMIPLGGANDHPNNNGNSSNNNHQEKNENKDDIASIEIIDKTPTDNDENENEKENNASVETKLIAEKFKASSSLFRNF